MHQSTRGQLGAKIMRKAHTAFGWFQEPEAVVHARNTGAGEDRPHHSAALARVIFYFETQFQLSFFIVLFALL